MKCVYDIGGYRDHCLISTFSADQLSLYSKSHIVIPVRGVKGSFDQGRNKLNEDMERWDFLGSSNLKCQKWISRLSDRDFENPTQISSSKRNHLNQILMIILLKLIISNFGCKLGTCGFMLRKPFRKKTKFSLFLK